MLVSAGLSSSRGYSWLVKTWNEVQDSLLLIAVGMDDRRVISLDLAAKLVTDHSVASDFHDGDFDLATKYGEAIEQTRLKMAGHNTVLVQMVTEQVMLVTSCENLMMVG